MNEAPKVTKFDSKTIEGIFVGYSNASKAYQIYVPTHGTVIESIHVKFDERTNDDREKGTKNIVGTEEPIVEECEVTVIGELG